LGEASQPIARLAQGLTSVNFGSSSFTRPGKDL
jgi:hypothetical protein